MNDTEQFFIFKDYSPVLSSHVQAVLGRCFKVLNMNPKPYGFQSLRSGQASDLLQAGVLVETTKKIGRSKSNAVYTYL